MKHLAASLILALIILAVVGLPLQAQDFPSPTGFVNDFGYLLNEAAVHRLEERLITLEKETGAELAVVTLNSLEGYSLEEAAVTLFEEWGIGKKDLDNGLLFLIAWDDSAGRYRYRIEVGYGLEAIITDGRAGRVLDEEVLPLTRAGDFEGGIEAGVIALENYIRDDNPPAVTEENAVQQAIDNFHIPFGILIFLGIVSIYMLGFMARTRSIWLGGIWGVICGLVLGFGMGELRWMIILPPALGAFGTLVDIVVSANYRSRRAAGKSTGWFSSGGGFGGSSRSGGSGRSGSFGGGRSGGGGASR